ncbi:MAG TPA: LysR family transcriptional regulator [Pusillimonas sp.]|uniref:LysR family transcriptional regulator n=1 Tax=Pusillimonas sp. TaxID=3040095 RepID=UPI002C1854BE|nr:LysR family transcriptional regulator [Pusillimonas sp.]HUH86450.1 LysR family transcriptional regulator [Pusillimonas sp.]
MNIKDVDLNLLRLFDVIYRTRNVSRAAEALDISQPAASQGLARLRVVLEDPLFVRHAIGVRPTPRAERLAGVVRQALGALELALTEVVSFDPQSSRRVFHIHMSDIGEGRFLPDLLRALHERAPGVQIDTRPVAGDEIADALDEARLDFAFGFLPQVSNTRRAKLLDDRYIVLLRKEHPFLGRHRNGIALEALRSLEFVGVRTHRETLRILHLLGLEDRLRLTAEHFMVLPSIVRATDLAVVMPRNIAFSFPQAAAFAIIEPAFPLRDFEVSLHWSRRFDADPAIQWFRDLVIELFAETGH